MNRTALFEILNRPGPGGRPAGLALADPPAIGADPLARLDPLPSDPKARLWRLLDIRAGQDDATETEANVKAVHEDIMDLFREHSREAAGWFSAWRTAHPAARLA